MFIAHLPASYLVTGALQRAGGHRRHLWVGLIGGLAPDLDLLYFYLVDQRQHQHHSYWSHLPWCWILVALGAALLLGHQRRLRWPLAFFFGNILLHLLLDTVAGGIHWAAPFSDHSFVLFFIPARFEHWVLNFIFHPSFLLELLLLALAVVAWRRWRGRPAITVPLGEIQSTAQLSIFSREQLPCEPGPR